MAKLIIVVALLAAFAIAESYGCICTMEYAPVCGHDGKTYGNSCGARCAGTAVAHFGPCAHPIVAEDIKKPCVCPLNFAPVCGEDGQMYSNACLAVCAGVPVVNSVACFARRGI